MIIGFVGLGRSGKDTAAAVLVEEYGYTRLGFADQLKKLALAIDPIIEGRMWTNFSDAVEAYGMEKVKDIYPEARRFLQYLGTEARNFLGEDVWIEAWRRALPVATTTLSSFEGGELRVTRRVLPTVTPDVRFLNEADAIRNEDGVIIRVVREGSGLTGSAGQHPSEIEQSQIKVDYTIDNNSTIADLRREVAFIVGDLNRNGVAA